jgi:O-acetyl-ADP-ribose deacetylase (regulator of RNase III)
VGPIWKDGRMGEPLALQVCVRSCLDKAEELGFTSIAMPAIRFACLMWASSGAHAHVHSSGIFGFPKDLCAKIMFETVVAYVRERAAAATCVRDIRFTNFDEQTVKARCPPVRVCVCADCWAVDL